MSILSLIGILLLIVVVYEVFHGYKRQSDRYNFYNLAKQKSKELNKPLIVYGDPYNGQGSKLYNIFMKTYGCGDETVDLTGCPRCQNGVKQDILQHLKSKQSNSSVIFVSCVLEYIPHIDQVIPEILRVAGSWENVFVVTIYENTIAAHFYKDKNDVSRNIVFAPPKYKTITYKSIK